MKKKISLAIALTAAIASFAASATESNLGYNSVELGYAQQARNDGWSTQHNGVYADWGSERSDTRLKGGYLSGSVELGSAPLYAFGSYAQAKDGVGVRDWAYYNGKLSDSRYTDHITAKEFSTGLGYYYRFNPNMNLITELSYVHQRASYRWEQGSTHHSDYNGGRVSVGYDAMLAPKLEGWVKASYTNMRNDYARGAFSGTVGMQYKITPMWGITAQGEFADKVNTYKMGVRMSF